MKRVLVVAVIALISFVPAAEAAEGSPLQHVSGGFRTYEATFWQQDGCLVRGANLWTRTWNFEVGGAGTTLQRTWAFVAVWNNCLNQSEFWAVGEFPGADVTISDDLNSGHVRIQGTMKLFNDAPVPATIDLEFVADSQMRTWVDGPMQCGDEAHDCVRTLRSRGGHSNGTFTVRGVEFLSPWLGQPQGFALHDSGVVDATVSCLMPSDADLHQCGLLELLSPTGPVTVS